MEVTTSRHIAEHERSLRDPAGFWAEAAEAIVWERRWDRVLDDAAPAVLPLVRGRRAEHLLQRARRARRARAAASSPRSSTTAR